MNLMQVNKNIQSNSLLFFFRFSPLNVVYYAYNEAKYKYILLLQILYMLFALTGCGFKPVYNKLDNLLLINDLNTIKIAPINSIYGAELYDVLIQDLPSTQTPKYILKVNISYSSRAQAIQKNSDIFREIITQTVNYGLYNIDNMTEVTSSSFSLSASYNTSFTPYASDVEQEQTKINLAKAAANQIKQKLILYFSKKFN